MTTSNKIHYKLFSEKSSYTIDFETTHISVSDIKAKVNKRLIIIKNNVKTKSDFDLEIYDNKMIKKLENEKIEPNSSIIIKRIPEKMMKKEFQNIIEDFELNIVEEEKVNNNFTDQDKIRFKHLISFLYKDQQNIEEHFNPKKINQLFSCNHCKNESSYGANFSKWFLTCCGESICDICKEKYYEQSMTFECHFCKSKKGKMIFNKDLYKLKSKFKQCFSNLSNIFESYNSNSFRRNDTQIVKTMINPHINNNIIQEDLILTNLLNNSKFIAINSSNKENIEISKKHNVWATTKKNFENIKEAFFNSQEMTTIFIFKNESEIQGFALMTSISNDREKDKNIKWSTENFNGNLSDNFSVLWLCSTKLHINSFKDKNPEIFKLFLNKIKDTLEYPKEYGFEICKNCIEYERKNNFNPSLFLNYEEKLPSIISNINKEKCLKKIDTNTNVRDNSDNVNNIDKNVKKDDSRNVVIVKNVKSYQYDNEPVSLKDDGITNKLNYNHNYHNYNNNYHNSKHNFAKRSNVNVYGNKTSHRNELTNDYNESKNVSSKKKYGNYSTFKKDRENENREKDKDRDRPERSRDYSPKRR